LDVSITAAAPTTLLLVIAGNQNPQPAPPSYARILVIFVVQAEDSPFCLRFCCHDNNGRSG